MIILTGTNARNLYAFAYGLIASDRIEDWENPIAAFAEESDMQLFLKAKGVTATPLPEGREPQ